MTVFGKDEVIEEVSMKWVMKNKWNGEKDGPDNVILGVRKRQG